MRNGCSSSQFSYNFGQQKFEVVVINCFCFSFKALDAHTTIIYKKKIKIKRQTIK